MNTSLPSFVTTAPLSRTPTDTNVGESQKPKSETQDSFEDYLRDSKRDSPKPKETLKARSSDDKPVSKTRIDKKSSQIKSYNSKSNHPTKKQEATSEPPRGAVTSNDKNSSEVGNTTSESQGADETAQHQSIDQETLSAQDDESIASDKVQDEIKTALTLPGEQPKELKPDNIQTLSPLEILLANSLNTKQETPIAQQEVTPQISPQPTKSQDALGKMQTLQTPASWAAPQESISESEPADLPIVPTLLPQNTPLPEDNLKAQLPDLPLQPEIGDSKSKAPENITSGATQALATTPQKLKAPSDQPEIKSLLVAVQNQSEQTSETSPSSVSTGDIEKELPQTDEPSQVQQEKIADLSIKNGKNSTPRAPGPTVVAPSSSDLRAVTSIEPKTASPFNLGSIGSKLAELGTRAAPQTAMPETLSMNSSNQQVVPPTSNTIGTITSARQPQAPTPVSLTSLIERVRQAVEAQPPPNPRHLAFQLQPAELGLVNVDMHWSAQGWNVNWSVDHSEVHHWLIEQFPVLQQQSSNSSIVWHAPTLQQSSLDSSNQDRSGFQDWRYQEEVLPEEQKPSTDQPKRRNEFWA